MCKLPEKNFSFFPFYTGTSRMPECPNARISLVKTRNNEIVIKKLLFIYIL
jgi:hypothetical protein